MLFTQVTPEVVIPAQFSLPQLLGCLSQSQPLVPTLCLLLWDAAARVASLPEPSQPGMQDSSQSLLEPLEGSLWHDTTSTVQV